MFNFTPYQFAWSQDMAMDQLHIQLLHEASRLSGKNRIGVEIGSFRGASTSALIEALNEGFLSELHIVEPVPQPELLQVVSMANDPSKIHMHTCNSWEVGIPMAHFVFIDGDHQGPALQDLLQALDWGADVICLHDSIRTEPFAWGSATAVGLLSHMKERNFFHDNKHRPDARTERGFCVSSSSDVSLHPLRQALAYMEAAYAEAILSNPSLPSSPITPLA